MRPTLVLLVILSFPCSPAVESKPVSVLEVTNGRIITVQAEVGGVAVPLKVTLQFLSLTQDDGGGVDGPSHRLLKSLLPPGSTVVLQSDGEVFPTNQTNGIEAVICQDFPATEAERAKNPAVIGRRTCIQVEMIRAGVATYWTQEGEAPYPLADLLKKTEEAARSSKAGVWGQKEKEH